MCPSFLPLPSNESGGEASGRHLLLFISHNKGCQYYIGTYDTSGDRFRPQRHGRMTWCDNAYFAPEALIDGQGRQIMWAWIFDDRPEEVWRPSGWNGMYGLPRSLWLGDDGGLRMAPVEELALLRQRHRSRGSFTVGDGQEIELEDFGRELMELEITMEAGSAKRCGVRVCCSEDGREQTTLLYDAEAGELQCDTTRSSLGFGRKVVEAGPLELPAGEPLRLRIFVDRSIVEVYANERQALARAVYPTLGGRGVRVFAEGGEARVASANAWELMPSNPY